MNDVNTRKITDDDIDDGYSNIDVGKTQEAIAEILRLDAYADEREDFMAFITNILLGRWVFSVVSETEIEKKDAEMYERKIKAMNDFVEVTKSGRVEEGFDKEWLAASVLVERMMKVGGSIKTQ